MNLLDLFVKIGVDDEASDKVGGIGEGIKNVIGGAAKVAGAAVTAASGALVALGTAAVKSFADFEQLTGGIETLFGTGGMSMEEYAKSVGKSAYDIQHEYAMLDAAQDNVMRNAQEAYKSAGLSANEYMETVTSFSASLIASLGGDTTEAVKIADKAIVMMADNSNKMGVSMESIQNAFRGFAKGNFTMLDNLSLGYGGTAEEMKRLLKDAEAISGIKYDVNSYADIIKAIDVIQTKMGITGTTAKEAASTISGSFSMLGAAWENVITQIGADSGDGALSDAINSLFESAIAVGNNLMPAIETVMSNIPTLISGIGSMLGQILPTIISDILPNLITSAIEMVQMLGEILIENAPVLIDAALQIVELLITMLTENASTIIDGILSILGLLAQTLVENIDMILDAVTTILLGIAQYFTENIDQIVQSGISLVMGLVDGLIAALPQLIEAAFTLLMAIGQGLINNLEPILNAVKTLIFTLVQAIMDNLPTILEQGMNLLMSLMNGILENLPMIIECIGQVIVTLIQAIVDNLPMIIEMGINLLMSLIDGILNNLPMIVQAIIQVIMAIVNAILDNLPMILEMGIKLIIELIGGLIKAIPQLVAAIPQIIVAIVEALGQGLGKIKEVGGNLVKGLWEGIQSLAQWLWDKVSGWISGIWDGICDFFGIASPSKKLAWVGEMMVKGLDVGMEKYSDKAIETAGEISEKISDAFAVDGDINGGLVTSYGGSGEIIVNTPVYLDGQIIANVVNKRLGALV